jgi:hypothetical protein
MRNKNHGREKFMKYPEVEYCNHQEIIPSEKIHFFKTAGLPYVVLNLFTPQQVLH